MTRYRAPNVSAIILVNLVIAPLTGLLSKKSKLLNGLVLGADWCSPEARNFAQTMVSNWCFTKPSPGTARSASEAFQGARCSVLLMVKI